MDYPFGHTIHFVGELEGQTLGLAGKVVEQTIDLASQTDDLANQTWELASESLIGSSETVVGEDMYCDWVVEELSVRFRW